MTGVVASVAATGPALRSAGSSGGLVSVRVTVPPDTVDSAIVRSCEPLRKDWRW